MVKSFKITDMWDICFGKKSHHMFLTALDVIFHPFQTLSHRPF